MCCIPYDILPKADSASSETHGRFNSHLRKARPTMGLTFGKRSETDRGFPTMLIQEIKVTENGITIFFHNETI